MRSKNKAEGQFSVGRSMFQEPLVAVFTIFFQRFYQFLINTIVIQKYLRDEFLLEESLYVPLIIANSINCLFFNSSSPSL